MLRKIAQHMPYPCQMALRRLYGLLPNHLRYNRTFWETRRLLGRSQWWSTEEIWQYQLVQMRKLLAHAYLNVPYYQRTFSRQGIDLQDIKTLEDFSSLPFLTKDQVMAHRDELCAKNYPRRSFVEANTGGSSGTPMSFYRERGYTGAVESAFMVTQWERIGYRLGDRVAVLRGAALRNGSQPWEYRPDQRSLFLSTYHLTDCTMRQYARLLKDYSVRFIHAYPSSLDVLAKFMEGESISPPGSLTGVLCGSEPLYPNQRELFERVFNCRVFSWYGHSEYAVLAGECEKSTLYHVFPEYGYYELVDEEGRAVTEQGQKGEIVGTAFHNYVFPFIRYRTGDIAISANSACSCGRNYLLLSSIEGRQQDYVMTSDRSLVPLTALVFGQHLAAFSRIRKMQLEQHEPGRIVVRVVRAPSFRTPGDDHEIAHKMERAVQGRIGVTVEHVEDVPPTPSGKHRFLLQHLDVATATSHADEAVDVSDAACKRMRG